jgi:hypothetical protein
MTGGAVLRGGKLTGPAKVRDASAHNKRTIKAELRAGGSIDPTRTHLNERLAGPATPDAVAALATERMAAAGVVKLRKDAVTAIEWLVSLPPGLVGDERAFFVSAMDWLAGLFGGSENVLSADIHRDEASPHMHLLLLPLIDGRMVGSDTFGGPAKLRAVHAGFYDNVCAPYGLKRYPRKLAGASKAAAVSLVLAELKKCNDPCLRSLLWPVVRDRLEADPGPFTEALGLALPAVPAARRTRSSTAIFISTGKGKQRPEVDRYL